MDVHYPNLEVNLDAIETNSRVLNKVCAHYGIETAGVIKFSDGQIPIAKAYAAGGCKQIAVSRAAHLRNIKQALPGAETLLTRAPGASDLEAAARWADLILFTEGDGLRALDAEAARWHTRPGVLLMLDVGDLREGVDSIAELTELAKLCERLPNLELRGVGTNHACLNGVLPTHENLSFLVDGAKAVEHAIGRKLDILSGGSSINLLLLKDGKNEMPPEINHLRVGGSIANPMNIRLARGVSFPGMREDSVLLTAEVIEIHEKASAPKGTTKNWSGQIVHREDKGRRMRAILALGSQDVGDAGMLIPIDAGAEIVGCSSDHTVVDVTDTGREWRYGDKMTFHVRYTNMLYAFSGRHVAVEYCYDNP